MRIPFAILFISLITSCTTSRFQNFNQRKYLKLEAMSKLELNRPLEDTLYLTKDRKVVGDICKYDDHLVKIKVEGEKQKFHDWEVDSIAWDNVIQTKEMGHALNHRMPEQDAQRLWLSGKRRMILGGTFAAGGGAFFTGVVIAINQPSDGFLNFDDVLALMGAIVFLVALIAGSLLFGHGLYKRNNVRRHFKGY